LIYFLGGEKEPLQSFFDGIRTWLVSSIVRLWGIIIGKFGGSILAGFVVCFVGFRDDAEIRGLDI